MNVVSPRRGNERQLPHSLAVELCAGSAIVADDPEDLDGVRASAPAKLRRRADDFALLGVAAIEPLRKHLGCHERVGVFVANTCAGWRYAEGQLRLLVEQGFRSMGAFQATAWFPAALQGEVTIHHGFHGCAKTFSGAGSALGEAFWGASDCLAADEVDVALVGAAEGTLSEFLRGSWELPPSGITNAAAFVVVRRASDRTARVHRVTWEPVDVRGPDSGSHPLLLALELVEAGPSTRSRVDLGGGFALREETTPCTTL